MYQFFMGLLTGFVETAKVGIRIVESIGNLGKEIVKDSKEVYNEFED